MSGRFEPLVLCYHAVSDRWSHALAVSPAALERQLRHLIRRGYRPASAGQAVGGSGRLLHVTFDDAYRSVAGALPLLERLGVPASVYACSRFADGGGRPLDVPELADEAAAYPEELATMDWDGLRSLAERGVEVGGHTAGHPHLPRLTDAEIELELRECRTRIEDELGRPCRYLAYPYGEHDARVRRSAAAAGYEAAFALPGMASPVDRYALPRVGVYRVDGRIRFALKMTGGLRRPAAALLRRP